MPVGTSVKQVEADIQYHFGRFKYFHKTNEKAVAMDSLNANLDTCKFKFKPFFSFVLLDLKLPTKHSLKHMISVFMFLWLADQMISSNRYPVISPMKEDSALKQNISRVMPID
ncbi:hypothetical protein [Peptoclostridium litorale]|uniref:hypothetical protein n=1 Tax=Peptoclostridium litorale TaxID=1557 RepID=UPI001FA8C055|nr:hypothetical protein [Peptoclostridium litorale]